MKLHNLGLHYRFGKAASDEEVDAVRFYQIGAVTTCTGRTLSLKPNIPI